MMRVLIVVNAAVLLAAAADYASFQLTNTVQQTLPISPRFVGLSIEISSAPEMFSVGGKGGLPRVSFTNLMSALRTDALGPNIRIGGNSADNSVYLPSGALPPGDTYRITDADLESYAAAVPTWGGTIALDVSLRDATNATLAVDHVAAAFRVLGGAPLLETVEIGNEVIAPAPCLMAWSYWMRRRCFQCVLPILWSPPLPRL